MSLVQWSVMPPRAQFALLAIVLGIATLVGCSRPEDNVVGSYVGRLQLSAEAQARLSKLPPELATQINNELGTAKLNLEVRGDKTFSLVSNSPAQTRTDDGVWSLADNKVTLNTKSETVNGVPSTRSLQTPDVFSVDGEAKTLTVDPPANPEGGFGIVFTKQVHGAGN
jgi:hypothetical protein